MVSNKQTRDPHAEHVIEAPRQYGKSRLKQMYDDFEHQARNKKDNHGYQKQSPKAAFRNSGE